MPAMASQRENALADEDVTAVLAYIKSRWPAEVLEMQKNATLEHAKR